MTCTQEDHIIIMDRASMLTDKAEAATEAIRDLSSRCKVRVDERHIMGK